MRWRCKFFKSPSYDNNISDDVKKIIEVHLPIRLQTEPFLINYTREVIKFALQHGKKNCINYTTNNYPATANILFLDIGTIYANAFVEKGI